MEKPKCEFCGRQFHRRFSKKQKFCSNSCSQSSRSGEKLVVEFDQSQYFPTDAPPGSTEKIVVLARRAELGAPLFHKDDRIDFSGISVDLFEINSRGRAR